jgi:hypothetical protein
MDRANGVDRPRNGVSLARSARKIRERLTGMTAICRQKRR